ncbi:MAG: DUF6198 family protein [Faecalibacterium sp.]|nr:DUF6198 family protein [Ruminococcus sp.]MCM1486073.1 DUF6198 family protein [Faecalibacterium sp.]
MKKIKLSSELVYILSILFISFAVAMISSTNFGISMIVAPAYIISEKVSFLTFGQSEYVVQGLLFIVFCILMKKVKLVYFSSFITGVIYGAVLDFWRFVIPHFNPDVTVPGALPFALKAVYFILGMLLTSLAIAMFFKTYIYPQVYDFFVKGITEHFGINQTKFKYGFDITFLLISCVLTFVLFRKIVGIGVGTIIMTLCNGFLIGMFGKMLDKFFEITPRFPKFAAKFDL